MPKENDFETALANHPDIVEDGLRLIGRQVVAYGRRMDLLFTDKHDRKLLVELKWGPIKDAHVGQILSYEGMILSASDPSVRVMLIGTRVPPNLRNSLDHHGIAWKEITARDLAEALQRRGDFDLAKLFESDASGSIVESERNQKTRHSLAPPSTRAYPDPPRSESEPLATSGACVNGAVRRLVERALARNQSTTTRALRFVDATGRLRWYINVQLNAAMVIQKGRFDGDEQFWRGRISQPNTVRPRRPGTPDLRFHLATDQDCVEFERIALAEQNHISLPWEASRRKPR